MAVTNRSKNIRDLARTRERILKAALAEFSARGLAGARTETIARRARVNKRMLFYCFGSKRGLYAEVLRRKIADKAEAIASTPEDLGAALQYWSEIGRDDGAWIRMLEWEPPPDQSSRRPSAAVCSAACTPACDARSWRERSRAGSTSTSCSFRLSR